MTRICTATTNVLPALFAVGSVAAAAVIAAPASTRASGTETGRPVVVAQAGSTGGVIGKREKAVSSGMAAPRRAATRDTRRRTGAPSSSCGRLAGSWTWFNGAAVTIAADGNARGGGLTARWTCDAGRVVMHWSHGFVDQLTLSADGTRLTGTNGLIPVWGKRKS